MTELDRLHEIIDALPPQQVHALLTLLAPPKPIGDEEFGRRLAQAPEEEVDEETIARILAAEAEQGESISHGELKQRLGHNAVHLAPLSAANCRCRSVDIDDGFAVFQCWRGGRDTARGIGGVISTETPKDW